MPVIKKLPKKKKEYNDTEQRKLRQSFYQSSQWKILRMSKLCQDPLCEKCKEKGIIKPAEDIHHLLSPFNYTTREIDWNRALDMDNLQSLCKECHSSEHQGGKTNR